MSRALHLLDVKMNEEGIRILEYDMCIWMRISGSIKKRSKSETRNGTQACWIRYDI